MLLRMCSSVHVQSSGQWSYSVFHSPCNLRVEGPTTAHAHSTGSNTATLVIFCACAYFTLVSNCKDREKRCSTIINCSRVMAKARMLSVYGDHATVLLPLSGSNSPFDVTVAGYSLPNVVFSVCMDSLLLYFVCSKLGELQKFTFIQSFIHLLTYFTAL